MRVRVINVTVVVEVLSIDSVPSLLIQAARQIESEVTDGQLRHDDGDEVAWSTTIGQLVRVEVQP